MGRTELLRARGMAYKRIEENGIFLPVSEAHCKFHAPMAYDDALIIETSLDGRVKGGLKFDYRIIRKSDQALLAEGYTHHPCVNGEGRVVRPPRFLRDLIEKIPGSDAGANIDGR